MFVNTVWFLTVTPSPLRSVTRPADCPSASIYSLAAFPALFLRLAPDRADQRLRFGLGF